jgi:hypothetical protein
MQVLHQLLHHHWHVVAGVELQQYNDSIPACNEQPDMTPSGQGGNCSFWCPVQLSTELQP